MSFGQRELKSQAAPGDACADEFSDTSSTLVASTKKAKSVQRDTFCFFRLNGSDGRRTLVPEKQGVSEANGLFRCGLYARIDSRRLHRVGMDSSSIPIFLLKIVISAVIPPLRKKARSAHLFACKRAHVGSLPLPPFCGLEKQKYSEETGSNASGSEQSDPEFLTGRWFKSNRGSQKSRTI